MSSTFRTSARLLHNKKTGVEWQGDEYAKNSNLQEYYAYHFIARQEFPTLVNAPEGIIVDVGCGDGRLTKRIYDKVGGKVFGIDLSESQIEHARKVHATKGNGKSELNFFQQSVTELDELPARYPNEITKIENTVDRFVSFNCMHWIVDHKKMWQQIHKALKRGGRADVMFVWDLPNFSRMIDVIKQYVGDRKDVLIPEIPWLSKSYKLSFVQELTNGKNAEDISFSVGEEGSNLFASAYQQMLKEIGFEIESFNIYDYEKAGETFLYKSLEEYKGFAIPWFPKLHTDPEQQKQVALSFAETVKPLCSIYEPAGSLRGYGMIIYNLHLHIRKL